MPETDTVRENDLLTWRIDEGNEITINNQAFAYPDKTIVVGIEHPGYTFFNLAQLESEDIISAIVMAE